MNNVTVEINEAIDAGYDVINQANKVLDYLNDARLWGIFDMFSDHSFLSGILKHSKLDDAQNAMDGLKSSLSKFNSEINDVKVYCDVSNVDFDGWMKFFDIFCDNCFVDVYTVYKISDSKNQIMKLIDEVKRVQESLKHSK